MTPFATQRGGESPALPDRSAFSGVAISGPLDGRKWTWTVAEAASNSHLPPHVALAASPSYRTLTGLGVGVTVVAALYFGAAILLPITVAVLLSFVLSPLVGALRRLRIPRAVAVVFSVGLALAIIGGVAVLSVPRLSKSQEICRSIRPRSRRRLVSSAAQFLGEYQRSPADFIGFSATPDGYLQIRRWLHRPPARPQCHGSSHRSQWKCDNRRSIRSSWPAES